MMTRRAWLLFFLSSVIWGVPYLFIKVAVDGGVPPAFLAWSRIALAAIVMLPLALRRDALRGLRKHAAAIVGYTFCEVAVPFVLIAEGERHIASSLTAILISSMPLMMAVLSLRFSPGDRPTGSRLVGLIFGFVGVVALLGLDVAGRPGELFGALLVLIATLGYAIAPLIISRWLSDLDPLGPVTASLTLAAIMLLPAAIAVPPPQVPGPAALASIVVLGVICTAAGLAIFFRLIVEAGPNRASVITYINPVVAVIVGMLVLGERLGAVSMLGLSMILGGSWLATRGVRTAPGTS
jgi:drug/metabolite transporter (DMT)-like permease